MVNVSGPRRLRRYERRDSIERFGGLNNELDPDMVRDNEFTELVNFNVTQARTLVKRPGFQIWSPQTGVGATKILAVYDTGGGNPQIVANRNDGINAGTFASIDGGVTWSTSLSGTRAFTAAVQYNNLLYLVDATGVASWNGTTLTPIGSSPGGVHIVAFKDRLWVVDGLTTSNLYYSDPGPSGVGTWGASSIIKIRTGDPSALVFSLPFADRLMLFKTMTVWQLFLAGATASWQLRILNTERGAISENAVLTYQGIIYMLSWDGVWRSDGTVFKELTSKVRSYFKKSPQPYRDQYSAISLSKRRILVTYRQKALPPISGVIPCVYLWYNLDIDAWSEMQLAPGVGGWRPLSVFTWYNPGPLIGLPATMDLVDSWAVDAVDSKTIYLLNESNPTDKKFNFNSHFRTKIFDLGDTVDIKRMKVCFIDADGQGAIPKIVFGRDNQLEETVIPAGSLQFQGPKLYMIPGCGYFRQADMVFDEASASPIRILSINFIFMLKSREAADT